MILAEGGNIFKDKDGYTRSEPINQTDVKPTALWLEQLTGLPILDNLLGSTGLRTQSGDIDIGVDKNLMSKDKLVGILSTWAKSHNLEPNDYISGHKAKNKPAEQAEQISFLAPIAGYPERGFVQVDFMLEPDLEWAKFAKRADADTKYKDSVKHIILNSVAKTIVNQDHPEGLTWSGQYGLKDRATGDFITKDPDEIARILLTKSATRRDLRSVEAIVDALAQDPKSAAKLQQAETDLAGKGIHLPVVKEGSPDWYKSMMKRLA